MASAPSPPPPPNPNVVAAAQGAAGVETKKAESFLNNVNVDSPDGKLEWDWVRDANGDFITETIIYRNQETGAELGREEVRKPLKKVTLSPVRQSIFDAENSVKLAVNQWALAQVAAITDEQANPLTTDGLPDAPGVINAPNLDQSDLPSPAIVTSIGGGDRDGWLAQVKSEIMVRLQPDLDRAREREHNRLTLMGLEPGMAAYDRAMEVITRQENDALIEAGLKAREDWARAIQVEAAIGGFANSAQELIHRLRKIALDHKNNLVAQQYHLVVDAAHYALGLRHSLLEERVTVRGNRFNEIVALIHGGHIQPPKFSNWRSSRLTPPPIMEATYRSYAAEMDIWKTQVAQHNQMLGGMLGFAGNMIGGLIRFKL